METRNFINALKGIQKVIKKEIKKDKKRTKKVKKIIGKKKLKYIFAYLEHRFKKLEEKEASYRYLLSHLIPNYQLDYAIMQFHGLLDIHNELNIDKIKVKNKKIRKKGKKLLKKYFYYIDYIMILFSKYMIKKYLKKT